MTNLELKNLLSEERERFAEAEIPSAALYDLFDKLLKGVDDGVFDKQIMRNLEQWYINDYFSELLAHDHFADGRYNFGFGEIDKDHPEFVVSGVCFNLVESIYASFYRRLFFREYKTVNLRVYLILKKLGISTQVEASYKVFFDGNVTTISGLPNLKDLYLKLKERFLILKAEKEESLRSAEKKKMEMVADKILSEPNYDPKKVLPVDPDTGKKISPRVSKPTRPPNRMEWLE